MICPECSKPEAHRSHREGVVDWAMGVLDRQPFRCATCKARFYAYRNGETSARLRTAEERKILRVRRKSKWKRSKRQLWAYGLFSLVLLAIVYELMQQRIGGDG